MNQTTNPALVQAGLQCSFEGLNEDRPLPDGERQLSVTFTDR